MMYNYLLVLLLSVVMVAEGKKYCTDDVECTELGDLFCIKSQCNLGVCGCPRGEAAIFSGSKDKYICVKVKRVGESCATDSDGDICGAENSECQDGKCTCISGVPHLSGETCSDKRYPGETCNSHTPNQCDNSECHSPNNDLGHWYSPVQYAVPTCACANSQKLVITNQFSNPDYSPNFIHPFVGSSYPTCVPKKIGDSCLRDNDCPDNKCVNSKCVCSDATKEPDYYKTGCYTPLNSGATCTTTGASRCDGSQGLICGDQCSVDPATPLTCTCGPWHTGTSTCSPIVEGGTCYGDYNCKGFSATGACVDGKCRSGGFRLASSVTGLLALLAFAFQHNLMF